jgi:hypothetical protein
MSCGEFKKKTSPPPPGAPKIFKKKKLKTKKILLKKLVVTKKFSIYSVDKKRMWFGRKKGAGRNATITPR